MSDKFQGKYRIDSARLQNWDYGSNGAYFITICTDNREHYFGEIENGKMKISPAGAIAHVLWQQLKSHAKNISLGEFIVMPNHVHGILILEENEPEGERTDVACNASTNASTGGIEGDGTDVACNVSTNASTGGSNFEREDNRIDVACNVSTNVPTKNEEMASISPKANSVSTIIRSYKSAVTNYCNRLGIEFAWQPRFHDHIIRNDEAFQNISAYIKNNPSNWKVDKFQ